MTDLLATYLNDHLMASTTGLEMFRRATKRHPELATVTAEIAQDREALKRMLAAVGGSPAPHKVAAGWAAEKVSRLKLDRRLLASSPLSDVEQLESLEIGVQGKLAGWRLLRALNDPRLDAAQLDELIARAERQAEQVEQLRLRTGRAVLTG